MKPAINSRCGELFVIVLNFAAVAQVATIIFVCFIPLAVNGRSTKCGVTMCARTRTSTHVNGVL
jgi:hypothetical protein